MAHQNERLHRYNIGQVVEVIGSERGLLGSFYAAEILARRTNSHYKVRYFNLYKENSTSRLVETLPVGNVRPDPPHGNVQHYKLRDRVDVLFDGAFWSGVCMRTESDLTDYYIYFPLTKDEDWYEVELLRPHFDWTGHRFVGQRRFNHVLRDEEE